MTAAGVPVAASSPSSLDPTAGHLWRASRGPVLLLVATLAVAVTMTLVNNRAKRGFLDPETGEPAGSRALAQLLSQAGVTLDRAGGTEEAVRKAAAGTTLLVAYPELLQKPQLEALRGAAASRVVLVAPDNTTLKTLAPGLRAVEDSPTDRHEPQCDLPAAVRAGAARTGAVTYEKIPGEKIPGERIPGPPTEVTFCYGKADRAPLAVSHEPTHQVVALGAPDPLTNRFLAEDGNAALAMNLLGEQPRLVWYLPRLGDALARGHKSFPELIPVGWKWGALQLAVAVVLAAGWRMRRLGPVVAEPLPVVVRAAESVEGRARLYQRAGARGRAAEALRRVARRRLATRLGLPVAAAPTVLVDAVGAHTDRPAETVRQLLFGPPPLDDSALVRLANELDALERLNWERLKERSAAREQ